MDSFTNLSAERQQATLTFMEIMGVDDFEVAVAVMTVSGWDVSQAVENFNQQIYNPPPPPPPAFHFQQSDHSNDSEDQWQQNFEKDMLLQAKKQAFNSEFPEMKLMVQSSLVNTRQNSAHLGAKQEADRIQIMVQTYLQKLGKTNSKQLKAYERSSREIARNKQFVAFLKKTLNLELNFAFGNFATVQPALNLVKSHLRKRPLLVYVHKQSEKAVSLGFAALINEPTLINFINNNFVLYGMFDNSDDYAIVQKHLRMTELPGFACYAFNPSANSELFLAGVSAKSLHDRSAKETIAMLDAILQGFRNPGQKQAQQKNQQKKQPATEAEQIDNLVNEHSIPTTNKTASRVIKDEQQQVYKLLEKEFQLKREQSKLNKQARQCKLEQVEKIRHRFQQIVEPQGPESIAVFFRLPFTGKSVSRAFRKQDQVDLVFDYVAAFCRDQFEDEFGEFDLVQTYPPLRLKQHLGRRLGDVFQGSDRENLIIKQT